ncbi:DUF4748 domain-containing protein [Megalops cyprinoides]|uniref:DUF4748 domain-containing protein n=1 Tax=Megalops cyprinoides TaxID=118141 RepID=UPI0018647B0D|nr:DUF4748 domain-containing protein [Megalops cyprinoides]
MAAPCRNLLRSVAVRGLCQISGRFLWTHRPAAPEAQRLGSCLGVPLRRSVHCGTRLRCAKTEPPKAAEELHHPPPEYIPKRKAKNPMVKIGYAWMIGLPSGIIGFILAKREVDKNRLKQLKIRQRMKRANEGEYESDRYRAATKAE